MTLVPLVSLGVRANAGHGAWAVVAFAFPALALVQDQSVAFAMLLFVMETLLASLLLAARVWVSRHAMRGDAGAAQRLHETWRVLLWFVGPFSLVCAVLIGVVTLIEADKGRLQGSWADLGASARWLALTLCGSAAIDSMLAPVRSVHWLETSVAWQGSRTAVLFLAVLLGWPIILVMGTAQGFFWTFFVLRLLSDVGSLRASERERIRAQLFDRPGIPDLTVRDTAKAPPPFAATHARHEADDPRRPG